MGVGQEGRRGRRVSGSGRGRGGSLGEEGGAVIDHKLEEGVGGAGREVGEEGLAAGCCQCT